ncbi:MAG: hypothetical protein ACFE0Q_18965 [Anaerolineae bacterium]
MTTPEQGAPPRNPKQGESGGGIVQWLKDTYNGLYVIVLKPRMPEGMLYAMGILGVLLGITWAYVVAPAVWTGGDPNRLNESSQRQWLLMTAVGTSAQNLYAPEQTAQLARAIPNPRAQIEAMLADPEVSENDKNALRSLLNQLPPDIDSTSAPEIRSSNDLTNFLWAFVVPIILMVVLIVVVVLLWRFLIYDNLVAPVLQRIAEMRDPELAAQSQRSREELKIQQEQRRLREELSKQSSDAELGQAVMTQLAIYTPGRTFDESYEIELESGEFLGQSGTVIAESVDPDPIAVEVWLFDMFSSKNIAKIFVTPQGYADPAIRSKLEADVDNPATDIVVADLNNVLTIDTEKLRLQAKFSILEINANGRFENFNMQMRAWNKDTSTGSVPPPSSAPPAGAPDMSAYDNLQVDPPPPPAPNNPSGASGAPDMSVYDDIEFDPPPPMPGNPSGSRDMSAYDNLQFDPPPPMPDNSPSRGSSDFLPPSMNPLNPPPLNPELDDDDDDDPFGGTGDFTPLSGR